MIFRFRSVCFQTEYLILSGPWHRLVLSFQLTFSSVMQAFIMSAGMAPGHNFVQGGVVTLFLYCSVLSPEGTLDCCNGDVAAYDLCCLPDIIHTCLWVGSILFLDLDHFGCSGGPCCYFYSGWFSVVVFGPSIFWGLWALSRSLPSLIEQQSTSTVYCTRGPIKALREPIQLVAR